MFTPKKAPTATLLKTSLATGTNHITGATTLSGSTSRTLSYSTGGLPTQDVRAGLTTYGYGYNAARGLTSVTQGGSTAGAYAYDFQGQRVFRETYGTGTAETAYVYDRAGHLLAEHNAVTGAVNREFIWIDDMPVALADISGCVTTIRYIHTGQIDEPLAVTSAAQAIIWNGYVDPMGNGSTFSTPTLSPALDMRLPGQSFQFETGSLSRNHYRDYDPSLGRYIEADPLGIDAGQNVFAYVDGDPLKLKDATGLDITIAYFGGPFPHLGIGTSGPTSTTRFYGDTISQIGPDYSHFDSKSFPKGPLAYFTIKTTPEQDWAVNKYMNSRKAGLHCYALVNGPPLFANCANAVAEALDSAGFKYVPEFDAPYIEFLALKCYFGK